MHSPLPDSSALEAGIIEDERPSRLSRVQDNVRNLLRASVPSSFRGSVLGTPLAHRATVEDGERSPLQSPLRRNVRVEIGALPSPSSSRTTYSSPGSETHDVSGVLFPPTSYQQQVQHMAHQSNMFNTRAIAALTHPDLSDPSVAVFLQHKTEDRQRRAWKRSRNRKLRHAESGRRKTCSWLLCIVTGLLLAAIVSTCKYSGLSVYLGSQLTVARSCYRHLGKHVNYLPRSVHPRNTVGHHRICTYTRAAVSI